MKRPQTFQIVFTYAITLFLCGPANSSVLSIQEKDKLNMNARGAVDVCWLGKSDSVSLPLRAQLQSYLVDELTYRAGIALEFHPDCLTSADPFGSVGIGFYDAIDNPPGIQNALLGAAGLEEHKGHPTTYSRGKWNHANLIDMILSSRFLEVNPGLQKQQAALTEAGRLNLQKSIALHEFLHVLGFGHEQDHPQSLCEEGREPSKTAKGATEYDPKSIMNYCLTHSFDFETGAIPLSALDLEGIRSVYPLH